MRYLLTFGGDPAMRDALPSGDAEREQARLERWWLDHRIAGRVLGRALLKAPFTATTVRFSRGGPTIHDGPFTDEAEAVCGYAITEAEDLDEVLRIALTWPGTGYIEIRPMQGPDRASSDRTRHPTTDEGVADS